MPNGIAIENLNINLILKLIFMLKILIFSKDRKKLFLRSKFSLQPFLNLGNISKVCTLPP